jgi:meiotically up-regulated gene 157 (Mug157) protein
MKDKQLATMFINCFPNTLDTTVDFTKMNDGSFDTFIITGDILAMWLRDSTNQVYPYIPFINKDSHLKNMIEGLINRQIKSVLLDAYANAFNKENDGSPFLNSDETYKLGFLDTFVPALTTYLHERKFEIDSLCSVIRLSYSYFKIVNNVEIFKKAEWKTAMFSILEILKNQQKGSEEDQPPAYFFKRTTSNPLDTLLWGVGSPARRTGMCKTPFRPSDDATTLPFNIPVNAMTVVSLKQLSELFNLIGEKQKAEEAIKLSQEIEQGIKKFGIANHPIYGLIYAYEVDGFGSAYFMDDAGIPSLLSLPYLEFTQKTDVVYQRTRKFILSDYNPYYSNGTEADGIGSPHIGIGHIWPMSIIMRAMTSDDDQEILNCLQLLKKSSANTGFIHESFWKNNVYQYTRPWFAWANSLFGELILSIVKEKPYLIFK